MRSLKFDISITLIDIYIYGFIHIILFKKYIPVGLPIVSRIFFLFRRHGILSVFLWNFKGQLYSVYNEN